MKLKILNEVNFYGWGKAAAKGIDKLQTIQSVHKTLTGNPFKDFISWAFPESFNHSLSRGTSPGQTYFNNYRILEIGDIRFAISKSTNDEIERIYQKTAYIPIALVIGI